MAENKPHRVELKPCGLELIASLDELDRAGFAAFSMGPVYVYGKVTEDLTECFAAEHGQPVHGTTVRFDRPIVAHCEEWNYILSIMDKDSFLHFKDWMMRLQLADKERRKFYLIRHYRAPLLDPFMLDQEMKPMPGSIDIFTTSGVSGLLMPRSGLKGSTQDSTLANRLINDLSAQSAEARVQVPKVPLYVDFDLLPPEEEVIVLGRAALGAMQ